MSLTPLDMVRAYSVIANGGFAVEPHIVQRVLGREGDVVFEARHPEVIAVDERAGCGGSGHGLRAASRRARGRRKPDWT